MDWLEAIGQDASLRHAPTEDLANLLAAADASEALVAAVASGDSAWLGQEFGKYYMHVTQSSQTSPDFEEPTPDEEEAPDEEPPESAGRVAPTAH
ncbi:hypothetical protein [Dyella japonica]|uniref:hypothetical protein n=1 Tax=Dyella japonica TaxID=231455 RepID=UPI0002E72B2D|nr:hypothetical protein [Dyella japonica]